VYELHAVFIVRPYSDTIAQILPASGFVMRFHRVGKLLSALQRGFYEVTAGECDEPKYNMA
jgi:hypothetical protein